MITIRNLTPHILKLKDSDGRNVEILACPLEDVACVSSSLVRTEELLGIPIYQTVYGEVINLPDPEKGVYLVVSPLVAARCQGRQDILIPGTTIRDENGFIVGINGLQRI